MSDRRTPTSWTVWRLSIQLPASPSVGLRISLTWADRTPTPKWAFPSLDLLSRLLARGLPFTPTHLFISYVKTLSISREGSNVQSAFGSLLEQKAAVPDSCLISFPCKSRAQGSSREPWSCQGIVDERGFDSLTCQHRHLVLVKTLRAYSRPTCLRS